MFAKKFLSVITLLLIGNQISSVSACTSAPTWDGTGSTCTTAGCSPEDYGYYYDSSTVIKVTAAATCEKVTIPGFYKANDGKFYSVKQDGTHSTEISPAGTCTAVFNIYTGGGLCIIADDTTHVIDIDGDDGNLYVVPNTGNFFAASGTNVYVKSEKNALTYVTLADSTSYLAKDVGNLLSQGAGKFVAVDNTVAVVNTITGKEYCVDDDTKIITERPENYCDTGFDCDKYYTCTSGVCVDSTTTLDERSGAEACDIFTGANCQEDDYGDYYFIGSAESKTEADLSGALKDATGDGYLYKCTISAGVGDDATSSCSQDLTTIGYLKNADSDHNTDAGIPYIECSATTTTTSITVNGQAVTVAKNSCKAIAKPGVSSCSGNTGKLIYATTYKLCIDESSTPVAAGTANYLVDAHSISTFEAAGVQSGYSVVVEVDDSGNFIRRAQTGKKYIYALKTTKRVYNKGETDYATVMCTGSPSSLNTSNADEYILNKTAGDLIDYYKVNSSA